MEQNPLDLTQAELIQEHFFFLLFFPQCKLHVLAGKDLTLLWGKVRSVKKILINTSLSAQ